MPFLASIEGQFAFGRSPVTTQPTPTPSSGIVTLDLLLYLDSGNVTSYPGTGTTWTDLSSNTNNATSLTGTTYSSSNGGIVSFNGTTGSGSLVSSKYNTPYTGKTVFVTGNLTAITTGAFRAMVGSGADNRNFNFYFYSPAANRYQFHYSASGVGSFSSDLSYTPGNWFTAAVTQNTDGTVTYYLNGTQVSQTNQTFTQYLSPSTEFVGRADNYWNGPLPVITVYKTALTAAQILQNHNAVYSRYTLVTANLVSWFDPSFVASYPGTGTTINDLSPSPVNGTMANITFTSPYFTYNGSNAQVTIPDNAKLDPGTSSWTMEAWVYPTTFKTGVVLGKFNNSGRSADVSYSIRTNPNGDIYAQVGDGTGSFVNSSTYRTTLSTWAQIVYVIKNTAPKSLETFVNGASIGSVSYTLSSLLNSSNALYLGSYNGGEYSQWFAGRIGITRLYNTNLTSAQVLQNFNADRVKYGL
jgi:hypothetical protein